MERVIGITRVWNRKTESNFLPKKFDESGSQLFLSDGEEKSSDRKCTHVSAKIVFAFVAESKDGAGPKSADLGVSQGR